MWDKQGGIVIPWAFHIYKKSKNEVICHGAESVAVAKMVNMYERGLDVDELSRIYVDASIEAKSTGNHYRNKFTKAKNPYGHK